MPWNYRKFPRSDDFGVSDMNGLISWVAQQISTVTRLIHDKHAPDYQKQEREKLYPTKPGSPLWLLDYTSSIYYDVCITKWQPVISQFRLNSKQFWF